MTWPLRSARSMLGRARADAWPLALAAAIVALTVLAVALAPRLADRAAADAVLDAVTHAGPEAAIAVSVPFTTDTTDGSLSVAPSDRVPETAEVIGAQLPGDVRRLVGSPIAVVSSPPLPVQGTSADVRAATLQLVDLWDEGPPAVTWVSGGPAHGPTLTAEDTIPLGAVDDPVEAGLSEAVGDALGADAGTRLVVRDSAGDLVQVLVSGIFRPIDPTAPIWSSASALLTPRHVGGQSEPTTMVAGLMSPASSLTARAALPPGELSRTYTFPALPSAFDGADPGAVARDLAGLTASSAVAIPGLYVAVAAPLETVLRQVDQEVSTARAQGAVLVAGLVVVALLTMLQVAALLARRRAPALRTTRARGGSLPTLSVELGAEGVVVGACAAAAGLAVAAAIAPGPVPWGGVTAVVAASTLVTMGAAVRAVGSTDAARAPANRTHRRRAAAARRARRVGLDALLVLVGLAAVLTVRRRGAGSGDWLAAFAPAAASLAGAVLALQLVGPVSRALVRAARRSRTVVPLLAAARAETTARRTAPFLTLATAAALVTVTGAVTATVDARQEESSWAAVGADVRVTLPVPDAALAGVAADLRTQPGVEAAVAARVVPVDPAQVGTTNVSTSVLLVDPAAFAALLAATPLADAPASWSAPGAQPRALVTGDLIGRGPLSLTWDHAPVAVDVVGVGPSIGTSGLPTVVVDAAAFGAAAGTRVDPDVLLVVGPGAEAAVRGADVDGEVVQRTGWLAEQRATPTTRAVTQLARACVLLLLVLGAAAALMLASTGAGERAASLARMRTLGLDGRGARRVSAGELVPYALGATSVGVLVGWLVLTVTGQSLGLFALGGAGFGHGVVVPWFVVAAPLVAVACMVVVVGVESGARRRERLGQVLRVGAA